MKNFILALVLILVSFSAFATVRGIVSKEESSQIIPLASYVTSKVVYLYTPKNDQASIQIDFWNAGTATITFAASNDYNEYGADADRYVDLTSEQWVVTSTGSSSFVKSFSALPYKNLRMTVTATAMYSSDLYLK